MEGVDTGLTSKEMIEELNEMAEEFEMQKKDERKKG